MNVLKLLRCFWKHPITRTEFKAVNYYVQYERVNHILHPVYQELGPFRSLIKHEDEIDVEIFQTIFNQLNGIANIQQLNIYTHETVLYQEYEEKNRAIFSNIAYGYDFRNLQINTQTNGVAELATRIMFSDASNIVNQNAILTAIPLAINLNLAGVVPSLIRADFMDRQRVEQILDRENGIDLTRFEQQ